MSGKKSENNEHHVFGVKNKMDVTKLEKFLADHKQPKYRSEQIKKAVFKDGVSAFIEVSTLPLDLRKLLDDEIKILSFDIKKILKSRNGQSIKALLELNDGKHIETVLMSPKPDFWSVCVSSQAGCPLGCRFCATGKMGFERNLTTEEITDQILFWKQYMAKNNETVGDRPDQQRIQKKITNIVFMGMGEPFLNWENVRKSIADLMNADHYGIGSRSISVSTAGIPDGITCLAEKFPQVNLAISLHFADDEIRSRYMPINKKYDLASLKKALGDYFQKTRRKIFIEYVLLSGINDSLKDASKLSGYLRSIGNPELLHVNLIMYNKTGKDLKSSSKETSEKFMKYLIKKGISTTTRKSLGDDISGACGQLAGK